MIWFFERGDQRLQCEIRPGESGGFELVWTTPDGQRHAEQSSDAAVLTERRKQLEESLKRDGWKRVGRVTPPERFL
jgi:hypothetical protein